MASPGKGERVDREARFGRPSQRGGGELLGGWGLFSPPPGHPLDAEQGFVSAPKAPCAYPNHADLASTEKPALSGDRNGRWRAR
jgi:hypothetical protein